MKENTGDQLILEMKRITKRFGGVTALENVDFGLRAGEIHGLVGENGAGKSTLVKIISGAIVDYEGELFLNGNKIRFANPRHAQRYGVGIVYQELSVINSLTVAENIFLGVQPTTKTMGLIDWMKMREDAQKRLADFGFEGIDVEKKLDLFSFAIKQIIEIIKALKLGAQIIIMDEPTSGISREEITTLFQVLKKLNSEGKSIIYISHHLSEVLNISDRITILRDGGKVDTIDTAGFSKRILVEKILGEKVGDLASREEDYSVQLKTREETGKLRPCLQVEGLTVPDRFEDVSFETHYGEALGLYGLVGSGNSAVGQCLFGLLPQYSGKIFINSREIRIDSPVTAKKNGISYLPEDRSRALVYSAAIYKNITFPYLAWVFKEFFLKFVLRKRVELSVAEKQVKTLRIKAPNASTTVNSLSGGNIQKVSLGRWLTFVPNLFIMAEPTRGIDVGAKAEIISFINQLKKEGKVGLIIISTEPETIMEISDRILVFSKGKVKAELDGERVNEGILLEAAT
jgi:ribose transport system ATP-binding protein